MTKEKCIICNRETRPLACYLMKCETCQGFVCHRCWTHAGGDRVCPKCDTLLLECSDEELQKGLTAYLSRVKDTLRRTFDDLVLMTSCVPMMHPTERLMDRLKDQQKKRLDEERAKLLRKHEAPDSNSADKDDEKD